MAITNYAELQTAAANWLVRGDLTARIPEFIDLAEARLNRVLRTRLAEINTSTTTVAGSRILSLPLPYSEALTVWIMPPNGTQLEELRFVDPAKLDPINVEGRPYVWTIEAAGLAFDRPCDRAYQITLRCLEKYALSDSFPTNDLLSNNPDIYLFAILSEAGPFLRDDDLAATYEARLERAIKEVNTKEARNRAQQKLVTEPGQLTFAGRRYGYNTYTDGYRA